LKLTLPFTGEFGMRKVLLEEVAELRTRAVVLLELVGVSAAAAPPPKMECEGPAGVEG
jgi:hypothetical protein